MNAFIEFDNTLMLWINKFSRSSQLIDGMAVLLASNGLRGAVVVSLLWWAWMNVHPRLIESRLFWPKTILGAVAAIGMARAAQNLLPSRPRPMVEPALDFQMPFWASFPTLTDWSSFPSDHAVLFSVLTTAIILTDRRIGIMAAIWTIFGILLPRIYVGLHYVSDVLAGVVLGLAVMLAVYRLQVPERVVAALKTLEDRHRGIAFALAFAFSFLCATLFDSVRQIVRVLPMAF